MARNHLKSWEISHNFSYISEFQKILLSGGKNKRSLKETFSVWNFESYVKNLNVNMKTYNPGHNILKLYDILAQVRFTTSKMKLDI